MRLIIATTIAIIAAGPVLAQQPSAPGTRSRDLECSKINDEATRVKCLQNNIEPAPGQDIAGAQQASQPKNPGQPVDPDKPISLKGTAPARGK